MTTNNVKTIHDYKQSIWLDFIDRKIMHTGELQKLIANDGIRGLTSNPAIFEKAISNSSDYDVDISELTNQGKVGDDIFFGLAIKDIKQAADILLPVYEEKISGADGYVSLEVSPHLARNTSRTIDQAEFLWKAIDKKNLMIKIPGTVEGLPAIRHCISEGININVTLLFGLDRYQEVAEAYISGLEVRLSKGKALDHIASVASFFLSRIDMVVDPLLVNKGLNSLSGKVAIASAKMAYQMYNKIFTSARFLALQEKGATPQRLLWASTANKDLTFSDTRYVEALIGPNTVNTLTMDTLDAFRDHGKVQALLQQNLADAQSTLMGVKENGIDLEAIAQQLEEEGIDKFIKPYEKMLLAISQQQKSPA